MPSHPKSGHCSRKQIFQNTQKQILNKVISNQKYITQNLFKQYHTNKYGKLVNISVLYSQPCQLQINKHIFQTSQLLLQKIWSNPKSTQDLQKYYVYTIHIQSTQYYKYIFCIYTTILQILEVIIIICDSFCYNYLALNVSFKLQLSIFQVVKIITTFCNNIFEVVITYFYLHFQKFYSFTTAVNSINKHDILLLQLLLLSQQLFLLSTINIE
eukprot:TRINITY_DN2972_c0_g1_i2.p2 TRINITY_DN2972_c0_g1~~TRINITY_DN2972_c0_g1_i2.p2  ORF type:complete len:213 (-),score=-22.97 TRINITY_DN2972_c0_g1_i2:174-812(-)